MVGDPPASITCHNLQYLVYRHVYLLPASCGTESARLWLTSAGDAGANAVHTAPGSHPWVPQTHTFEAFLARFQRPDAQKCLLPSTFRVRSRVHAARST